MQGTLDERAIIITQDQGKVVFMLFLMIGLVLTFVAISLGAGARLAVGLFLGFTLGGAGSFGPCWEMTAQEMVTLLGEAKEKWG